MPSRSDMRKGEPKGRPAGGYLTAAEVCRRYGIGRTWLETLVQAKRIKPKASNCRRWYRQAECDEQMPHRVPAP